MPEVQKRLLLVEDNPYDLELTQLALELIGVLCEVVVARDGEEALDFLHRAQHLPDLILLDLNMPRVNGHEVLRALKQSVVFRHLPVVIFTTSGEEADRAACAASDADGYVVKPASFEGTLRTLQEVSQQWLTLQSPPKSISALSKVLIYEE